MISYPFSPNDFETPPISSAGTYVATVFALLTLVSEQAGRTFSIDEVIMRRNDVAAGGEFSIQTPGKVKDLAAYPVKDLCSLLLDMSVYDASKADTPDAPQGDSGYFDTFISGWASTPTEYAASQKCSAADFLALASDQAKPSVTVPLVPLLQYSLEHALGTHLYKDLQSCEEMYNASVVAVLCAFYCSFDRDFQSIFFPSRAIEHTNETFACWLNFSSFIDCCQRKADTANMSVNSVWSFLNSNAPETPVTWVKETNGSMLASAMCGSFSPSGYLSWRVAMGGTAPQWEKSSVADKYAISPTMPREADTVNSNALSMCVFESMSYINPEPVMTLTVAATIMSYIALTAEHIASAANQSPLLENPSRVSEEQVWRNLSDLAYFAASVFVKRLYSANRISRQQITSVSKSPKEQLVLSGLLANDSKLSGNGFARLAAASACQLADDDAASMLSLNEYPDIIDFAIAVSVIDSAPVETMQFSLSNAYDSILGASTGDFPSSNKALRKYSVSADWVPENGLDPLVGGNAGVQVDANANPAIKMLIDECGLSSSGSPITIGALASVAFAAVCSECKSSEDLNQMLAAPAVSCLADSITFELSKVETEHAEVLALLFAILLFAKGDVGAFGTFEELSYPSRRWQERGYDFSCSPLNDFEEQRSSAVQVIWDPLPLGKFKALAKFCEDLTEKAYEFSASQNLVGRTVEKETLFKLLSKIDRNSVLLVGKRGTGKGSIVRSACNDIVSGDVPEALKNKRVMQLDLDCLADEVPHAGEFMKAVTAILQEASDSGSILFIDGIEDTGRFGNQEFKVCDLLHRFLKNGRLCLVSTSSSANVKKIDPVLELVAEEMNSVRVLPPKSEELAEIVAAKLSETASKYGIAHDEVMEKHVITACSGHLTFMPSPLRECDIIETACAICKNAGRGELLEADVYDAVRIAANNVAVKSQSEILVESLNFVKGDGVSGTKPQAFACVAGQKEAISRLTNRLLLAEAAIQADDSPKNVLLFAGPSGVGKTLTAMQIPEFLGLGREDVKIISMSDFSERHAVSRLIGSPPGYIGYDRGGELTEFAKTHPNGVVILDEVEKSHQSIVNMFLGIFDRGIADSADGTQVDYRKMTFVCTTNAGFEEKKRALGFGIEPEKNYQRSVDDIKLALAKELGAPFVGRIDEVMVFTELTKEDVVEACEIGIENMRKKYAEAIGVNIDMIISKEEISKRIDELTTAKNIEETGARGVWKTMENEVNQKIIERIAELSES